MRIREFRAWRPREDLVARVASVPYDVVNREEARALAGDDACSFLRVIRPDIDLPDTASAEQQRARAVEQFRHFKESGILVQEPRASLYAYRQAMGDHVQTGIVACCHAGDYDGGVIRKHEHTRPDKEEDRARHMDALNAQTGPVFLTYRDDDTLDALVAEWTTVPPLYDFTAPDGVRHQVWRANRTAEARQAFERLPCCYIADGHHRAASAARVARARRDAGAAGDEHAWFLVTLFPASQLCILPYNRAVRDLNGHAAGEFLAAVEQCFRTTPDASPQPAAPGQVSMYLGGTWYGLQWAPASTADAVSGLDVSVLQDRLLGPVLGIDDPRTSPRIEFIGGIRGTGELAARVDRGEAAVAFSMHPTTVEQLMRVSDAGDVMPPKSTWFEPKLRSGLFVHELS